MIRKIYSLFHLPFIFSLLILSTSYLSAFEGRVVFKMNDGKSDIHITYLLKDQLVRTEIAGGSQGSAVAIMDFENNKTILLIKEMQMYMEAPLDSINDTPSPDLKQASSINVEKTGKTMEILGYNCEQYIVKDEDGSESEIWATKALGAFFPIGKMGKNKSAPKETWETLMADEDIFPLKVTQHSHTGVPKFQMTAESIEEKTVSDDQFQVPAGFNKFEMPNMSGQGGDFPGVK
jgi:hypothetical protein